MFMVTLLVNMTTSGGLMSRCKHAHPDTQAVLKEKKAEQKDGSLTASSHPLLLQYVILTFVLSLAFLLL